MTRKIDVGRVVTEVFETYRSQAGVLLPIALVIFTIEGLLRGLLGVINPILLIVGLIISIIASYLYQGFVVQLVADVRDGRRDATIGDLFRAVTPVLASLIVVGILAGLGIGIGLILLIVPGLFLLTIWAVVAPVVVLERTGVGGAFGRSRELVRDNGWQVLGALVIFLLILVAGSAILGAIGAAAGAVGRIIAGILSSVLFAPLLALTSTTLYFHLREIKGDLGPGAGVAGEAGAGTGALGGGVAGAPGGAAGAPGAPAGPTPGPGAQPGAPGGGGPQSPTPPPAGGEPTQRPGP